MGKIRLHLFLPIDKKPSGSLKKLALGKYYAWAITDVSGNNKVYRTELQPGQLAIRLMVG